MFIFVLQSEQTSFVCLACVCVNDNIFILALAVPKCIYKISDSVQSEAQEDVKSIKLLFLVRNVQRENKGEKG